MKKLALHWKILLGMLLGVIFALIMTNFEFGKEFIKDWIKPFGTIFINSLKLIAIPLILAALIKGVSDLKDISKLSRMGGRTIPGSWVASNRFSTLNAMIVSDSACAGNTSNNKANSL